VTGLINLQKRRHVINVVVIIHIGLVRFVQLLVNYATGAKKKVILQNVVETKMRIR
jgi:hypothetical protein